MPALLNAVTHYSLLRGVRSPRQICSIAKELGYAKVAIADYDNIYALPTVIACCSEMGLTPIVAVRITEKGNSAILYAQGADGYANICRIISERQCDAAFSLPAALKKGGAGVRMATDHPPWLLLLHNLMPVWYAMYHPCRIPAELKRCAIKGLIVPEMALAATDDRETHRLLRAIDLNTTLSRLSQLQEFATDARFEPWENIRTRFGMCEDAVQETEAFMEEITSCTEFGALIAPNSRPPAEAFELLQQKTLTGARHRYHIVTQQITDRISYELDIILQKGFAEYFLIVDDIVRQSPRTCGRGSAAASIVSYCLGITNVDPIRYNLMFERFLNPGRTDPPDIDVDFAWDERDQVLRYVFEKYGDRVAMVSNHLTFGTRMAIREVARVYGLTEQEISSIAKRLPHYFFEEGRGIDISRILKNLPAARDIQLDPPWPEIITRAKRLVGLPCGISTHCGGVVITAGSITRHAPVQLSATGRRILQWEKEGTEEMGLVKIDLLGNRSLAVIRDAIKNIRHEGVVLDESMWSPADDAATVNLLANGKSMGVFYVESPAMRLLQEKARVGDFEHMVIHSSIIRPAANKYIREYIRRLHGEKYQVEHPALAEVLGETFGIMVYQEDVAKVAVRIAGFSYVDADGLRKVISKKARAGKLEQYRGQFESGAAARGVSPKSIAAIWNMILSFSGYSFCKPHSASYVQVSFQSAYLKAHHPAAFMAAVISNFGGFYTTQAYISETQRLGVVVLRPDVNESALQCSSQGMSIRIGFSLIKGLGADAKTDIIREREKNGRFVSLQDLMRRTSMHEGDGAILIQAGACDGFLSGATAGFPENGGTVRERLGSAAINRSRLFWELRSFFRGCGDTAHPAPDLKPHTWQQVLSDEYATMGFLTAIHPIIITRPEPCGCGVVRIHQIRSLSGKTVAFYGWCVTTRTLATTNGEGMEFVTFEDETGIIETVLFPQAYAQFTRCLAWQEAFLVRGTVTQDFGAVVVEVEHVAPVK